MLSIFPSMACNLTCRHCFMPEKTSDIMQPNVAYDVANWVINSGETMLTITGGGEPFLAFPAIKELLNTLSEADKAFYVTIKTNGTFLIYEEMLTFLLNVACTTNIHLRISISDSKYHRECNNIKLEQGKSFLREALSNSHLLLPYMPNGITCTVEDANQMFKFSWQDEDDYKPIAVGRASRLSREETVECTTCCPMNKLCKDYNIRAIDYAVIYPDGSVNFQCISASKQISSIYESTVSDIEDYLLPQLQHTASMISANFVRTLRACRPCLTTLHNLD